MTAMKTKNMKKLVTILTLILSLCMLSSLSFAGKEVGSGSSGGGVPKSKS